MLKSAIATVMVSDMNAACRYYGGLHPRRDPSAPSGAGGISIGFGVSDIDAERARLESAGVVFRGPTKSDGPVKLAFFSDPDGSELYLAESAY